MKITTSFFGKILGGIGLLSLLLIQTNVQAQQRTVLDFYYGAECPHCHKEMKWFPELKKMYPHLEIQKYEVWHDTANQKKWAEHLAQFDMEPQGVPTNIIGEEVIVGFNAQGILAALEKTYGPPQSQAPPNTTPTENNGWKKYLQWSWPLMSFALGIIDGFNPCAMWSLFVLIGFLLTIDDKKKRWMIGGVFLASSGIIYFAALLTYLLGFTQVTTLVATSTMTYVFRAVGILALVTGFFAIKNMKNVGVDCEVRDADSKRKFHTKLKNILEQEKLWLVLIGVTGLAFSVNAIELLCSFAIPTAFTATLISTNIPFAQQLMAISIYDLAYMLDDIIVFAIAMWTLNLKVFSPKMVQWSHAIGGIILVLIGLLLLINPEILATLSA